MKRDVLLVGPREETKEATNRGSNLLNESHFPRQYSHCCLFSDTLRTFFFVFAHSTHSAESLALHHHPGSELTELKSVGRSEKKKKRLEKNDWRDKIVLGQFSRSMWHFLRMDKVKDG